jgi:hypothetical protein
MITAIHALLYSEDPEATRAFFRDVLNWPYWESEPGWPIFRSGPSELAIHPSTWTYEGETTTVPLHHDVSFMCDDLEATVAELTSRGAEFSDETTEPGWGLGISLRVPGAGEVLLYQPRYEPSHSLPPQT